MYRSGVETLNHHHLFHFWTVVREGGVTRASEKLHVCQPTVSGPAAGAAGDPRREAPEYGVRLVGRLDTVRQRFYAITVERPVRNPAVIAISERGRALFA